MTGLFVPGMMKELTRFLSKARAGSLAPPSAMMETTQSLSRFFSDPLEPVPVRE